MTHYFSPVWWRRSIRSVAPPHVTQMVGLSILVGIVAGLAALTFSVAVEYGSEFCMEKVCGVHLPTEGKHIKEAALPAIDSPLDPHQGGFHYPPWSKRLWILLVPALGGLLCGWLVFTFAPEAEGHGTDAVVEAFHQKQGLIRYRIPPIKLVASVLTISTGGNAGREGPIAQIAAGFGAFMANVFRLSARRRRILLAAGVGAGVGAMFRAPLGGALFAVDVLYRDTEFEYEALIPAFIASIVSYTAYAWLTPAGMGAIFSIPENLSLGEPSHLFLCLLLAPLLALAGIIYTRSFYGITGFFRYRVKIPRHLKPALGGLVLGIICFFQPQLLTTGYGWVQQALDGNLTVTFMLFLVAAKVFLTGLTVGSGGSGGVFGPSVVIGGLLGGAFGTFFQRFFPDLQPAAFVLLGMGGFFAGAAKVPISTIIMVSEMTVGYALLLPLMLVCSLSYLLSPRHISIYTKQVSQRVDSPAHLGDFVVDLLERIQVRDVMSRESVGEEFVCATEDMPLAPLLESVSHTPHSCFPVLNDRQEMTGIIRLDDLRGAFLHPELQDLVIAEDIAFHRYTPLYPEDNMNQALRKMTQARCEELPVVEREGSKKVIAMLGRREILQSYSRRMEGLMREGIEQERQPLEHP